MTQDSPGRPRIRAAAEEDLPTVVEIIREAWEPLEEPLDMSPERVPSFAAYTTIETFGAYIARQAVQMQVMTAGDEAVACGGYSTDHTGAPCGWLNRIAVRPRCQGHGYGGAMVAYLEDQLREQDCTCVKLGHVTADQRVHEFYTRRGYTTFDIGRSKTWHVSITYMEKPL